MYVCVKIKCRNVFQIQEIFDCLINRIPVIEVSWKSINMKSCLWPVVISYYYFSSLKVVIPFSDCTIYTMGFLFCGTLFSLSFHECLWEESYGKFHAIMFLGKLCSTGIIRCICVDNVIFLWIWVVQNWCSDDWFLKCYEGIMLCRCPFKFGLLTG